MSLKHSEENFSLLLACRYFIEESPRITDLRPGDELLKINGIAIDQLSLREVQRVIDQSDNRLILDVQSNAGKRLVSLFISDSSGIGIRLAGGNRSGLFIGEVQPKSVAARAGLGVGDRIHAVNDLDFTGLTREDAVLYLLSLRACRVTLLVSRSSRSINDIGGDSFYIRTHFARRSTADLPIGLNEIFHVVDTLANDQVGYWKAINDEKQLGLIPNQSRAEQISYIAPTLDQWVKGKRKADCWKPMIDSKFRAYERVRLKPVTIVRPVVFLGPLADIARDRLLEDYPDQFELPDLHLQSSSVTIIKLSSIKNVIEKNRHCLLDITPSAIEQLNYAECYPIVIFFRANDRRQMKEIRREAGKDSPRHLWSICQNVEEIYSYLFTSILPVDVSTATLKTRLQLLQDQPIWMSAEATNETDFFSSEEYFIWTSLEDIVASSYFRPTKVSIAADRPKK